MGISVLKMIFVCKNRLQHMFHFFSFRDKTLAVSLFYDYIQFGGLLLLGPIT